MTEFVCLTYTHRQGDVHEIPSAGKEIKDLLRREEIDDFVLVRTCNRAEAYFFSEELQRPVPTPLTKLENESALKHLLEVVSGVNSLVVGETEILSQVREAYNESVSRDKTNSRLREIFDWALRFGKKVRRETEISSGKTSVASIGLDRARDIIDEFEGKKAVVVGAGSIGSTAARYLKDARVKSILVANRTYENAVKLANEIGGESHGLSKLPKLIKKARIVICATGAPHYIITEEKMPPLEGEKVLLDLSVPSNVHPKVREKEKIKYVSYEELTGKARENLINRKEEVERVKGMVKEEVKRFTREDPLEDLYREVEKIRREQVKKAMGEIEKRDTKSVLNDFSRSLSNKILSAVRGEREKLEKTET